MKNNDILGTLGLCLKAKKLAVGDDAVYDFFEKGHARAILITKDAGNAIKRKLNLYKQNKNIAIIDLPFTKEELGNALGKTGCSICCISDSGFASSIAQKLADINENNKAAAQKLHDKNEKIERRKGVKKTSGAKETEYVDMDEDEYYHLYGKTNDGGER